GKNVRVSRYSGRLRVGPRGWQRVPVQIRMLQAAPDACKKAVFRLKFHGTATRESVSPRRGSGILARRERGGPMWWIILIILAVLIVAAIIIIGGRRARDQQSENNGEEAGT